MVKKGKKGKKSMEDDKPNEPVPTTSAGQSQEIVQLPNQPQQNPPDQNPPDQNPPEQTTAGKKKKKFKKLNIDDFDKITTQVATTHIDNPQKSTQGAISEKSSTAAVQQSRAPAPVGHAERHPGPIQMPPVQISSGQGPPIYQPYAPSGFIPRGQPQAPPGLSPRTWTPVQMPPVQMPPVQIPSGQQQYQRPPVYQPQASASEPVLSVKTGEQIHSSQSLHQLGPGGVGQSPAQAPLADQPAHQPKQKAATQQFQKQSSPAPSKLPPGQSVTSQHVQAPKSVESRSSSQEIVEYGLKIPKRREQPVGSKKGRPIKIETNFLPLTIDTKKEAIHYDVVITPELAKKQFPLVMKRYIEKNFPGRAPAFDGNKNLYSSGPLPITSDIHYDEVEILEEGRKATTKFSVTIKFAARVDLETLLKYQQSGSSKDPPQTAVQCLDVILRHSAQHRFVKVGRSFFTQPKGSVISLGGGLELWHGVFQSAIMGWKPFINVDVAHKGFPKKQNVVDLLVELSSRYDDVKNSKSPLNRNLIESFKKYIKNLKILYEIPGHSATMRSYRVNDIMDPPDKLKFKMDDGKVLSVSEYFWKERKYRIEFPHLPCLWVGSRTSERKIYYPVELCTVLPGQVLIRKMDGTQTSNLIKSSAVPANERKQKIMDAIKSMQYNSDPTIKEFGLKVVEKFETVNARVIDSPTLEYANNQITTPRNGIWNAYKFNTSAKLHNWYVLVMDRCDARSVDNFVLQLIESGKKLGMEIHKPVLTTFIQKRDLKEFMSKALGEKMQMVIVIISGFGDDYAQVKQNAELGYGVLTQCIKGNTVNRMNPNTASMLLLKINAKLDCINHKLYKSSRPKCLNVPCMILGADVTHPPPGQLTEPSIAALAASHDPTAMKYNITLRFQPPKVEIISDLKAMVEEQLLFFYKSTNRYPLHIIYFRDGVSEGQFEQVLNSELVAIRAACKNLQSDKYEPKISFFIVQKRHHARFFPVDHKDADRNANAPPGTCVDTTITHPTEMDFYLLSHASIKGTARPTRYHCIWDDASMLEAEVQELAYYLCHMFTRCNRAVSYPAPTYYAHLAAARARVLTDGVNIDMNNLQKEQRKLEIKESVVKERPMFFV